MFWTIPTENCTTKKCFLYSKLLCFIFKLPFFCPFFISVFCQFQLENQLTLRGIQCLRREKRTPWMKVGPLFLLTHIDPNFVKYFKSLEPVVLDTIKIK